MRYVTLVRLCVKGWRRIVGNVFCIFSCDAEPFLRREACLEKKQKAELNNAVEVDEYGYSIEERCAILNDELNERLSKWFKEYSRQFPLN